MAQMTGEPGTRMTGGTGSEEEMRFTSREARMSILEFATGRTKLSRRQNVILQFPSLQAFLKEKQNRSISLHHFSSPTSPSSFSTSRTSLWRRVSDRVSLRNEDFFSSPSPSPSPSPSFSSPLSQSGHSPIPASPKEKISNFFASPSSASFHSHSVTPPTTGKEMEKKREPRKFFLEEREERKIESERKKEEGEERETEKKAKSLSEPVQPLHFEKERVGGGEGEEGNIEKEEIGQKVKSEPSHTYLFEDEEKEKEKNEEEEKEKEKKEAEEKEEEGEVTCIETKDNRIEERGEQEEKEEEIEEKEEEIEEIEIENEEIDIEIDKEGEEGEKGEKEEGEKEKNKSEEKEPESKISVFLSHFRLEAKRAFYRGIERKERVEEEEEGSGGGRGGLKKIFFERQCSLKVPEHGELFATYFVPFLKGLLKGPEIIFHHITNYFYGICSLSSSICFGNSPGLKEEDFAEFFNGPQGQHAMGLWEKDLLAGIYNRIGRHRKKSFSKIERQNMERLLLEYTKIVSQKEQGWLKVFSQIAFDHIEYFSTHHIDPCNVFVGAIPSSFFEEKLFLDSTAGVIEASLSNYDPRSLFMRWRAFEGCPERVHKEINDILKHVEKENIAKGDIVALNVAQGDISGGWFWNDKWGKQDIFGDYILVRVARLDGMVIDVYVHPHESMILTVPRNLIHSLDWSETNPILQEGNASNVMFFSDPLFCLEQMIQGEIKKIVETHLSSAGYNISESKELLFSKLSKENIEVLMVNQGVLDDFSFATYEKLCLEIENNAYYLCMGWLEHLPLGLVVSQMSDALSQVENVLMKISQSVKRELNNYQEKIIHQLSVYQSLIKKIATGARKEEVFDQILLYIETQTDNFLKSHGYGIQGEHPAFVPHQKQNEEKLKNIFDEKTQLGDLVAKITKYVYSNYLDIYLEELEILNNKKTGPFLCNNALNDPVFIDSKTLKKTHRYLKEMEEVDQKVLADVENGAFEPKKEFFHAVPIQALVVANLTIHEESRQFLSTEQRDDDFGKKVVIGDDVFFLNDPQ